MCVAETQSYARRIIHPAGTKLSPPGERQVRNLEVRGSIPLSSTTKYGKVCCFQTFPYFMCFCPSGYLAFADIGN